MALSTLAQTIFNAPYGIDETNTRMWLRGKFVFSASPGTYATGGLLPGWGVTTANILNPLADSSGQNVTIPTYTQPASFSPTLSALTSNVATITAKHSLVVGQFVTFAGLTNCPFLNGLTLQVASVSTTVSFTVAFTHANVTSAAENGVAVLVIGPDDMEIHSVSGSGFIYVYNKAFATIQVFTGAAAQAALTELAAGATPAGVSGDIVHFVATWAKQ